MSCQSLRRSSSRPVRVGSLRRAGDSLRGRRTCIASDDDGSTVTSKLIPLTMSSEQHSHSPPSRDACTLRSFPSGLQAPVPLTLRACTHARRNTVNAVAVARGMVRETGGWRGPRARRRRRRARQTGGSHHAKCHGMTATENFDALRAICESSAAVVKPPPWRARARQSTSRGFPSSRRVFASPRVSARRSANLDSRAPRPRAHPGPSLGKKAAVRRKRSNHGEGQEREEGQDPVQG
jgi:hypothetical protein